MPGGEKESKGRRGGRWSPLVTYLETWKRKQLGGDQARKGDPELTLQALLESAGALVHSCPLLLREPGPAESPYLWAVGISVPATPGATAGLQGGPATDRPFKASGRCEGHSLPLVQSHHRAHRHVQHPLPRARRPGG